MLHVIFDGPPSHESGRFVEVETPEGKSVCAGDWIERADGLWALAIPGAGDQPDASLSALREYFVENHDIVDCDGKQLPNWAMKCSDLLEEIAALIASARSEEGKG